MSRRLVILVAVLVFALVGATGGLWLMTQGPQATSQGKALVGGPFKLTSASGEVVDSETLKGQPYVIFFGFTHCPEVCPTTLYEAAGWLQQLGPDAEKFRFYFITVDPERDTPEALKEYVASFDPRITGITGAPDKIAKVLADYRVYAKRVELEDGDYTMDHTATVYLIRGDGSFAGTISYNENPDIAIEKLRNLIKNG
jgi:protein SCO1/2